MGTPQVTPQAVEEQVTPTQAEPPIAIIDPPETGPQGNGPVPEGLDEREERQYRGFVKDFRDALHTCNATARQEILTELLRATEADPKLTGLWWHTAILEGILKPIGSMNEESRSANAIARALETLMAETRKVLDPADEFAAMEAEIRATIRNLPPKVRAVTGILVELASLDSLSIEGTGFPNNMLYKELADDDAIRSAIGETGDDPDMRVLAKAYDLAEKIIENE